MNDQEGDSRKDEEEGTRKELVYVQPVGDYSYHDDEISLVDLVGVLLRRKGFIIGGTLLIALLAVGFAFTQPVKFKVSSLIEVGQLYTEQGSRKIESSGAVKNRIQALGQVVGRQLMQETREGDNPVKKLGFSVENDFRVDISEGGNILTAEIEAPKDSQALPFLDRVGERLIKNHNRIFNQEKTSIKNQIKTIEIQNKNIDTEILDLKTQISEIKRNYEAKIEEKENTIEQISNAIDNLKARKDFLQARVVLLEEEKKTLESRIETAEKQYDQFLSSKLDANNKASESAAIGLMLFNSELQQMRKYRDELWERQQFGIPEQVSKLRKDLKELEASLRNRKAELALEKNLLGQLEPEMEDKIANVKGEIQTKRNQQEENQVEIEGLRAKLDNMIGTRVVLEPMYSENPVSPNIKLAGALGVVLGLFLSVFGAFLIEFWESNKENLLKK